MSIEDAVKARLKDLLFESRNLVRADSEGMAVTDEQRHERSAWLASAQHLVHLICLAVKTPYLARANTIAEKEHGWLVNQGVGEMAALLRNLLADAEAG